MDKVVEKNLEVAQQSELNPATITESAWKELASFTLDYERSETSTNIDGLSVSVEALAGKQQSVYGVTVSNAEKEKLEVIVRPTYSMFASLYEEFPEVRESFPKMYQRTPYPNREDSKRNVVMMERIQGYDEKSARTSFDALVAQDSYFLQLADDMFESADKLLQRPIEISDTEPMAGHNVFYNLKEKRFQFFDVDTISRSDDTHAIKYLKFIDAGMRGFTPKKAEFTMLMLKKYLDKYSNADFSKISEPVARVIVKENVDELPGGEVISPDHEDYELYYRAIRWEGTFGLKELKPIAITTELQRDIEGIIPELLSTCQNDDKEGFVKAFQEHKGYFFETRRVPADNVV